MSNKVQLKGKVIDFQNIEMSKDTVTIIGVEDEKLVISFKGEDKVQAVFQSLGVAIMQHVMANGDKVFDVAEYLVKEGYGDDVLTYTTSDNLMQIEQGVLPEVMYRYKNRFGIIKDVRPTNLDKTLNELADLEDLEDLEELDKLTSPTEQGVSGLTIVTNSGEIHLKIKEIKTIDVLSFVDNFIRLMILKSFKYSTPINLDTMVENLEQTFLLNIKVVDA